MTSARERMQARQAMLRKQQKTESKPKDEVKPTIPKAKPKKKGPSKYDLLENRFADLSAMFVNFQQKVADQLADLSSNTGPTKPQLPYSFNELEMVKKSFEDIYNSNIKRYESGKATGKLNSLNIIKLFFDNL